MDSAWDQLLALVERLADEPDRALGLELEQQLVELVTRAMNIGDIDTELSVPGTARWVTGLVIAHRTVRETHPDVDPEADLGELLRIATRWLHPARPR